MQKHVNLVDLVKSFPTYIYLQNLASIQKRTSLRKFVHLAEKSEKGLLSNLSTKAEGAAVPPPEPFAGAEPGPAEIGFVAELEALVEKAQEGRDVNWGVQAR